MEITEAAYEKAIHALSHCSTSHGLFASGTSNGYTSVWARDSMISLLGGALVGDRFRDAFKRSLDTLAEHQSERGQIPNCVDIYEPKRKKQVTFATIDSSLWYLIGEHYYAKIYGDESISRKHRKNIEMAMLWVKYQDSGEEGLPEQQPTCDWEDCFPHKYGHAISTQALYYCALRLWGEEKEAKMVKEIVNGKQRKDLLMFDYKNGHYHPWIWKDHNELREEGHFFDSLGNTLAIAFGLADKSKADKILDYIETKKVNKPFPLRAIHPPIRRGSDEWQDYFTKCLAGRPHQYINGGIWPYIGGFYVCALVAAGKQRKAKEELASLARANKLGGRFKWEFNEWIEPHLKKTRGSVYQAWSAGTYILAYESVKRGKIPVLQAKL